VGTSGLTKTAASQDLRQAIELAVTAISLVVAAYIAGYLAARLAGHAELLNGALSSAALVLYNIADNAFGPFFGPATVHLPPLVDFAMSNSGPVFGLLGGYVAQRRGHAEL
jgi:hypothetical protein